MRKELLWAGIIGIIFGVAIGFGTWRVRSKMKAIPNSSPTPTPQTSRGQVKIALDKPENLRVYAENPISVTGLTKSLNWVIISTDDSDYLTTSLDDGSFSQNVDFSGGVNHIQAVSIDADGGSASQKILALYSESFKVQSSGEEEASDTAELAKSVAEKLAQSQNPPKAYIGTVTDIAESTIQIKSLDSQIQQISTEQDEISVVNTKETTSKTVKLTDIAIGDFIIAMGYADGNEVLEAKRILISNTQSDLKINTALYKVASVGKKSIEVTPVSGGETLTITPDKNTVINSFSEGKTKSIKLANISVNDMIIIVSDISGTPSITRTMFDLISK